MNAALKYSDKIDSDLKKSIQEDLNIEVKSIQRFESGEVSYAYKIKTSNGDLIGKVFKFDNFVPDKEKLFWIERKLESKSIPFAKTLKLETNSKYFPFGYMVQGFIEGKNGFESIMDGSVDFKEFFKKLITLLKSVHEISTDGYGSLNQGKGEYPTFYESKLHWYKSLRKRLEGLNDLEPKLHDAVLEKTQKLKDYEPLMKSVLLHGDATPHNVICTPRGDLVLIDWDNSGAGVWQSEYAGLTYKGAYIWQFSTEEERNRLIKEAYVEVYPEINFNDPNLLEIVEILQILTAYGSLVTHYFQHQDIELYQIAKKRLKLMLKF